MIKSITELGPKEAEFISMVASKGRLSFTIHEAVPYWGSRKRTRQKLSHLVQKGWLERIERGQYIVVPFEAGPERKWSENPYIIASLLTKPAVIAYWSAIRFWNWTEQMPRVVYVLTTQLNNNKTIFKLYAL